MGKNTSSNVTKATAVGVGVGSTSAVLINYGASELERKYGVPQFVTVSVLGSIAGFFMRWAAKLNPHD